MCALDLDDECSCFHPTIVNYIPLEVKDFLTMHIICLYIICIFYGVFGKKVVIHYNHISLYASFWRNGLLDNTKAPSCYFQPTRFQVKVKTTSDL